MNVSFVAMLVAAAVASGELPDPAKTPGVANLVLTTEVLCAKGFSTKRWRLVTPAMKRAAYAAYGLVNHQGICVGKRGCEIDHLVPIEVGGANDPANLWPQPFVGTWNASRKDRLENRLHALVCSGTVSLEDAQHEIATDWISSFKARIGDARARRR